MQLRAFCLAIDRLAYWSAAVQWSAVRCQQVGGCHSSTAAQLLSVTSIIANH